jgi:hypothetical protein
LLSYKFERLACPEFSANVRRSLSQARHLLDGRLKRWQQADLWAESILDAIRKLPSENWKVALLSFELIHPGQAGGHRMPLGYQ